MAICKDLALEQIVSRITKSCECVYLLIYFVGNLVEARVNGVMDQISKQEKPFSLYR